MRREKETAGRQRALECLQAAESKKAKEAIAMDMREISSIADYFVICSGTSDRHVKAIAESVIQALKESGVRCYHSDGWGDCSWIVLDYGDVIVHVFLDEARRYYQLERLWGDSKLIGKKTS